MVNPVRNVLLTILLAPLATASAADADVASTYRGVQAEIHQLEQQIATQVRNADMDGFLAHFSLPDDDVQVLTDWFRQVDKLRQSDGLDHILIDLPLLGATSAEALVRYGRFDAYFSTGTERCYRWPPVVLQRRDQGWVFIERSLTALTPLPEAEVKHAVFEACPLMDSSSVTATASFTVANAQAEPLGALPVYIHHPLRLEGATLNGRPFEAQVTFGTLAGRPVALLLIPLSSALKPNASAELSFHYSAAYDYHDLGRKPVGFTADRGFVLWESGWYPHFRQEWEMFPYEMSITVPDTYMALTSGELTGRRDSGGARVYSYRTRKPEPPFFIWGRYEETSHQTADVKLIVWTPTGGTIDPRPMMDVVLEAFNAFQPLLPPPDFKQHRIVAVTRYGGYGATENLLIHDPYFSPERIGQSATLDFIAHELSHSWVNSLAQPTGEPRLFLAEGLATYLGAKAVEKSRPAQDGARIWQNNQADFQGIASRAVAPRDLSEKLQYEDNRMFRGVAYTKGAYFFRELETLVGEDVVFKALGQVMREHRGASFTLEDLTRRLDELAGRDLAPFWKAYLDSAGAPDYAVTGAGSGGSAKRVVVKNFGLISPTPVDVVAYDERMQELERTRVVLDSPAGKVIDFDAGDRVAHVVVDPDKRVLQAESRNDVYPDYLLSSDDNAAVESLIAKLLQILRDGDIAAFESTLTSDTEVLSVALRDRLVSAVRRVGALPVVQAGPINIFRTGEGRAEATVPVKHEAPSGTTNSVGEFNFVLEEEGWKLVTLRIR